MVLQFHPELRTAQDRVVKARCFYPEEEGADKQQLDWELIRRHTQRREK